MVFDARSLLVIFQFSFYGVDEAFRWM